jgi:hypothetical protein
MKTSLRPRFTFKTPLISPYELHGEEEQGEGGKNAIRGPRTNRPASAVFGVPAGRGAGASSRAGSVPWNREVAVKTVCKLASICAAVQAFSTQASAYTFSLLHPSTGAAYSEALGVSPIGDQQVGRYAPPGLIQFAGIWSSTADSFISLHPAGWYWSSALGAAGGQQVGYGQPVASLDRAVLWTGTADSAVDLTPAGWNDAQAHGTDGVHQVGFGRPLPNAADHALLWSGTAGSYVDLHPAGPTASAAYAINGNQIVGAVDGRAALWDGLGAAFVDLGPPGTLSVAYGVGGGQQVGRSDDTFGHALLWRGSAGSVADLHPGVSFIRSVAYATNGTEQVGSGDTDGGYSLITRHALVWSGGADTVVDLNVFLSAPYNNAVALSVDATGNVYGYVWEDSASTPSGPHRAAVWAVPEPGLAALFVLGGLIWRTRHRHHI